MLHSNQFLLVIGHLTNGIMLYSPPINVFYVKSLFRIHRKHKSLDNLNLLISARRRHNKLINTTKAIYYKSSLSSSHHNMKNQFSICNSLLGRIRHSVLPNKCSLENATLFALFFNNKIYSIIASLPSVNFSSESPNQVSDCHFHEFFVPSRFALVKLLKACNSSSSIDPIPLPLFKLIDEDILIIS